MKPNVIWCALNGKEEIFAIWYKGCKQKFGHWKEAVRNINPNCKIKACSIWPVNS